MVIASGLRLPKVHLGPAFRDANLSSRQSAAYTALFFAGFENGEVRHLHLLEDPVAYNAAKAYKSDDAHSLKRAIIDVSSPADQWRKGVISREELSHEANLSIYNQLKALADVTPRKRSLASYLGLNVLSACLSGYATVATLGISVNVVGIKSELVNFSLSAGTGIATAITLGSYSETTPREVEKVRKERLGSPDSPPPLPEVIYTAT